MSCQHIRDLSSTAAIPVAAADGCPDCIALGYDDWVHLRECCSCGHVGCCDSSPRRHASAHFAASGHPVMRSLEPGESWQWCFIDETIG